MTNETRHLKEELQELLDNRLSAEIRLEAEEHLKLCEECRRELDALRWTKQFSRQKYAAEPAPANLEENILAALDLEDRRSGSRTVFPWSWRLPQRAILAYGFLLCVASALVLSYFILREPSGKPPELASQPELSATPETPKPESTLKPELSSKPELPAEVAQDYRNYKAEQLPLLLKTADVRELEKFFFAQGITFETRVFDLGMMNYRLVGGRVHQLNARKSALFVYRGKGNKILICQMYQGQVTELPAGSARRKNKGIQFYIYRVNGVTTVFWQEGTVTCVLTSDIAPEEIIQLAFAKAVKI